MSDVTFEIRIAEMAKIYKDQQSQIDELNKLANLQKFEISQLQKLIES